MKCKPAELVGINPTYLRIGRDVSLDVRRDGQEETYVQDGLWEWHFTGTNKKAIIEGVVYNPEL